MALDTGWEGLAPAESVPEQSDRIEQDHRAIKQRYYLRNALGFKRIGVDAKRFCSAFEELRQYLRIREARQ